jgi:hypothetical protein
MTEKLREFQKNILRAIAWKSLSVIIRLRLYGLLAWFFARRVVELQQDGSTIRAGASRERGKLTILALSPHFFRGDMQCFADTGEVRVLLLDQRWLTRLMFQFYPLHMAPHLIRPFVNPHPEEATWEAKIRYRDFLRNFLPRFNQRLGIDCAIGHHFLHRANVDWGAVFEEIGVRYVALHSESMLLSMPHTRKWVCNWVSSMGKFEGSHIIVYCQTGVDAFSSTGFVPRDKISSLGAPRMDPFVRKIKNLEPRPRSRKQVSLFTFLFNSELDAALHSFFRDVHLTIAELAMENPDLDFVLKSKRNFWKTWRSQAMQVWQEAGLNLKNIPNIKIGYDGDPHELIFDSDVVCALNSTTLLEAGLTAKPIVVPYFGALRGAEFDDRVLWRESLPVAFDVATTKESFKALIMQRLEDPIVDEAAMAERRRLFEKYLSDLEGTATERYINLLTQIVTEGRNGEQPSPDTIAHAHYVKVAG